MKKTVNHVLVTVGIVVLIFSSSAIAQGVDRAELLASMCVTCHGPDGQGSKRIPSLDNHKVKKFVEIMNGFKTGEERATIMDRHAGDYTDEDILLIAKYFFGFQK